MFERFLSLSSKVVLCLLLASGTAVAGKGTDLLDRFLNDTQNMSARFKQTLVSEDGFVMQESSGQFYLQRPGKFRWDYAEPYEQQIVSDGENIYIYDVDLAQVTVQSQQQGLSNTPMALMEGKLQLTESFDIQELDQRDGIYRLKLNSKNADADFNDIIVGVDHKGLRFLQLIDQFEQKTDIVFDGLRSNVDMDAGRFRFDPPEGVDVFGGS